MTLSSLLNRHRTLCIRYKGALQAAPSRSGRENLDALEGRLENLERRILEYPVRNASELRRKLDYIGYLTQSDPYLKKLVGRAAIQTN